MFILLFIVIFLVAGFMLIYVKRNRKNKAGQIDPVEEYHRDYIQHREEMQKRRNKSLDSNNFVTRFNSSEDYREK